jgi:nucleotide-binding universal stress UspA family protein
MSTGNVIVALRDTEHVEDLVMLGCQLAKGTGGDVIALHVVEVAPALPLDAQDEALDAPAERILAQAKVAAETSGRTIVTRAVRSRHAGEAIAHEAKRLLAEMVVVGYRRKSGLLELLVGSTVQYLVDTAPCKVVITVVPAGKHTL